MINHEKIIVRVHVIEVVSAREVVKEGKFLIVQRSREEEVDLDQEIEITEIVTIGQKINDNY